MAHSSRVLGDQRGIQEPGSSFVARGAAKFGVVGNRARLDAFADSAAFRDPQVVVILQIEPELRGQTEILSQPQGGVGTDSAVPTDDLVDARKIQRLGQRIRTYAHWFHELGLQNFSGMDGKNLS